MKKPFRFRYLKDSEIDVIILMGDLSSLMRPQLTTWDYSIVNGAWKAAMAYKSGTRNSVVFTHFELLSIEQVVKKYDKFFRGRKNWCC